MPVPSEDGTSDEESREDPDQRSPPSESHEGPMEEIEGYDGQTYKMYRRWLPSENVGSLLIRGYFEPEHAKGECDAVRIPLRNPSPAHLLGRIIRLRDQIEDLLIFKYYVRILKNPVYAEMLYNEKKLILEDHTVAVFTMKEDNENCALDALHPSGQFLSPRVIGKELEYTVTVKIISTFPKHMWASGSLAAEKLREIRDRYRQRSLKVSYDTLVETLNTASPYVTLPEIVDYPEIIGSHVREAERSESRRSPLLRESEEQRQYYLRSRALDEETPSAPRRVARTTARRH